MNRNTWAAIAAATVVVVVIILGFRVLGSPRTQRKVQSDLRTVRLLAELAQQINLKWSDADKELPKDLESFPSRVKQDQLSGKPFGYRVRSSSAYELCAEFTMDNRNDPGINTADPWIHPKGQYCFQFDATQQVPVVPFY